MLSAASRNGTSTQRRHTFSWFLLITANVLWATSYVAAKFALHDVFVALMLALRMGISALVLLPLLVAGRKTFHMTRAHLLVILGLLVEAFYTVHGKVFAAVDHKRLSNFKTLKWMIHLYKREACI